MTLFEKLSAIQQALKVPKKNWNEFGKYHYRNAEGILEAFKPFEEKYKVALCLSDDIVLVGDRIYVRAEATLFDLESNDNIRANAFAREPESKKGMDGSQITGTASSYARKYALNGLFLLDDTKDADSNEYHKQTEASEDDKTEKPAAAEDNKGAALQAKKNLVLSICREHKLNPESICAANGMSWRAITEDGLDWMIKSLDNKYGARA